MQTWSKLQASSLNKIIVILHLPGILKIKMVHNLIPLFEYNTDKNIIIKTKSV